MLVSIFPKIRTLLVMCSISMWFMPFWTTISVASLTDNLAAEMVTTQYGRKSMALLKIKGDKVRIEVKSGRDFSTMIARYDKNILWLLHPAAQKYRKMSLDSIDRRIPHFFRPGLKINKIKIDEEEINGQKVYKYKARIVDPAGRNYNGFLWTETDLDGFPVKWEDTLQGITVEWRNIVTDELSSDLFELPEKYAMITSPEQKTVDPGKHQGQHATRRKIVVREKK